MDSGGGPKRRPGGMGTPRRWFPPRRLVKNMAELPDGETVRTYPAGGRPLVAVTVRWDDGVQEELRGVLRAWCGHGDDAAVLFEGRGLYGWFSRNDVRRLDVRQEPDPG